MKTIAFTILLFLSELALGFVGFCWGFVVGLDLIV